MAPQNHIQNHIHNNDTIEPPVFMFEPTIKAAEHNRIFIQKCGGVEQAIQAQANSPVSYGSEFRPTWCLHPLMNRHPLWFRTESLIFKGTKYPLTPIPDSVRKKDLAAAMTYGNHKSTKNSDTLSKSMSTEIEHGFALPLPPNFRIPSTRCRSSPSWHCPTRDD